MSFRRRLIDVGDQGLLMVENIIITFLPVQNDRVQKHFVKVYDVRFNLFHPFIPFEVILKYF
jgi:hypothetical protein